MSSLPNEANVRCPMCGEYCPGAADRCPSCGESRTPSGNEFPKEDRLGQELRALAALWFIVGLILLWLSVLVAPRPVRVVVFQGGRDLPEIPLFGGRPETNSFLCTISLTAGGLMIAAGGMALQRWVRGIRFGSLFSIPVAIAAVFTCFLIPFSILLIMGMQQSQRVTKWIKESEAFYEEAR